MKTYTKDDIKKYLTDKDLIVIGEIKTTNDKVHCRTVDGYDVLALPSGIITRGDNPSVFSKYNPYTISNIQKWLNNNDIKLTLISTKYISSTQKLKWKCGYCENTFETTWATIKNGKKFCNFCSHSQRYDGYRDYYKIISDECNKYNYHLLSEHINRYTDVFDYICKKHQSFGIQHSTYELMISQGKHCKFCGYESRGIKHRCDESRIRNLVEAKGFIYCGVEYGNYINTNHKQVRILYKCKEHIDKGIQKISLGNLKTNKGNCEYCMGRYKTKDDLQKEIDILETNVIILDYTDYSSSILAECKICGNKWNTTGVNLSQGHGCPHCHKSNFEKEIQRIFDSQGINYIPQYRFKDCRDINPLPFDFYLYDLNILVEVDGEGHYIPIRRSSQMSDEEALDNLKITQLHDEIKNKYCFENGIKLVRIPYWERKNAEQYMLKQIS